MTETTTKFSTNDLSVLERPGAKVEPRLKSAGCRVTLANGWGLSIQWGPCMYGSNYDVLPTTQDESDLTAETAEIAIISPEGHLIRWADDDTVQGWCTMERVQGVLDKMIAGTLISDHHAPDERRADDGFVGGDR